MSDEGQVSILFFKNPHCVPCRIVDRILTTIVNSSKGSKALKLTKIDTDVEKELVDKYFVKNVPIVFINETKVLTANQVAELLGGSSSFEHEEQEDNLFSSGQSMIFSFLLNEIISAGRRSIEERRQDWNKHATILLAEKDILQLIFRKFKSLTE